MTDMAKALIKGDTSRWGVIKEGIKTKAQEFLPHAMTTTERARTPLSVSSVEASAYTDPDRRARGRRHPRPGTRTTLVLVQVAPTTRRRRSDSAGPTPRPRPPRSSTSCSRRVVAGCDALDVGSTWEAMVARGAQRRPTGAGRRWRSRRSTSPCGTSRRGSLGLPLHRLLGRRSATPVPVYGSGGFTTYDDDTAARPARAAGSTQGIPRVKIKIGESWGGDERARPRAGRAGRETVVGADVEVFVDANGGYSRDQACRVGRPPRRARRRLVRGAGQLRRPRRARPGARASVQADVAAGEYGYDLAYFAT